VRKSKSEAFEDLAAPLGEFVFELRASWGTKAIGTVRDLSWGLRNGLRLVVVSPEPELALAFMMTAVVLNVSADKLDRPDPIVERYAQDFIEKHRREFAEAILTWQA